MWTSVKLFAIEWVFAFLVIASLLAAFQFAIVGDIWYLIAIIAGLLFFYSMFKLLIKRFKLEFPKKNNNSISKDVVVTIFTMLSLGWLLVVTYFWSTKMISDTQGWVIIIAVFLFFYLFACQMANQKIQPERRREISMEEENENLAKSTSYICDLRSLGTNYFSSAYLGRFLVNKNISKAYSTWLNLHTFMWNSEQHMQGLVS